MSPFFSFFGSMQLNKLTLRLFPNKLLRIYNQMTDWLWQLLLKISGRIKSPNLFTLVGIENTRGGWKPEGATIWMCVLYPFRAWRLGSSSSRGSVLAMFLLLPGMSLRVYVRVHAESISLTQTHTYTHNHRERPGDGLCICSPSFLMKKRHMQRQPLLSGRGSP